MKNVLFSALAFVLVLFLTLPLSGCGQAKAASGNEAIKNAEAMETVDQKVNYLLKQANTFYNSKDFQEAVNIAQYILRNLDSDSQQAEIIIKKAKEALASAARGAVEDVKKSLPGFGQ